MPEGISEAMPGLRVKGQRAKFPNSGVRGRVVMRLRWYVGLHMICFVSSQQIPQGVRRGSWVAVV